MKKDSIVVGNRYYFQFCYGVYEGVCMCNEGEFVVLDRNGCLFDILPSRILGPVPYRTPKWWQFWRR